MLKRLFIAVFVLSLVVGLNGTAFSDVVKGQAALDELRVQKVNPNHPRFAETEKAGPDQPAFKKPASALEARILPPGDRQVPATKLDYFCDLQDYTSGAAAYFWQQPDQYGDSLFNMRFTADANYDCTLKVAHLLMYAPGTIGDPDMRVYLWDDDGFGFPGMKLDSVDVPFSTISTEFTNQGNLAFISADFSAANWVFSDGEEYHIGYTPIVNSAEDTLAIISDDGTGPFSGEERASEFYAGAWGTMLNDWGLDVSFFILAERCCAEIPFSDCYSQAPIQNIAYFWRAPHPTYGDEQYSQKFSVGGPETLVSVDVAIYDPGDGSFGNDDVLIRIFDDNAGLPGNLLHTETLPAGTYPAYPSLANVPLPVGFVLDETFHISFGSSAAFGSGEYESTLSSDGSDGVGGSASDWDSGPGYNWVDFLSGWGIDVNFYYVANLCRDEYAECSINACYGGLGYFWRLPDRYGDFAQAQKFAAVGEECRVQEVSLALYWPNSESGQPLYTEPSEVTIFADAGGLPGAAVATIPVGPAEYAAAGMVDPGGAGSILGFLTVDFTPLDAFVTGAYWAGITSLAPDTLSGIRTLSDPGGSGLCADAYAENYGAWGLMSTDWGLPSDVAMVLDAEHCCIPFSERACGVADDFSTYGGDYARTHATDVQLDDPWCDLTLNWGFEHPTDGVGFTGPTAYGDMVVCAFGPEYRVFDLVTGAQLYIYDPTAGPFASADIRTSPTIDLIPGYPDPIMFVTGGTNDEVHAVDFLTGATIWTRDVGNVGPAGLFGDVRWGVFTVVGSNVYWGTEGGYLVGADALTGTLLAGFPINLGQAVWTSLSTDGVSLFTATRAAGSEGDVYSIDAATGAINWQLSATDGLQGATEWAGLGYTGDEGFTGGVSYDAPRNALYINSRAEANYPTDGLFYRLDAASGNIIGDVTLANRVFYSTPVLDAANAIQPALTRWVAPPTGGNIYAVNKGTGLITYSVSSASGGRYYTNAVLSCEPAGAPDLLYAFNEDGFLSCFNADDGDELYRRRVFNAPGYAPNIGMGVALTIDGTGAPHLLASDFWGNLVDMTKGADRPRLEIQTYSPQAPVEFGAALSFIVTIEDVFANTGCADLTFSAVNVDELSFGPDIPSFTATNVSEDFMNRSATIADQLTDVDKLLKQERVIDAVNDVSLAREYDIERSTNYAAAGFPSYLNSVVFPTGGSVIPAGDTADLVLDVIQVNIDRGPQPFYIELVTDDPDFFLNDPALAPQILVTLVGGCLTDTTTLEFGMGGANIQLVTNSGRLGTGDWSPHGFDIDGDASSFYQGTYVYGVSQYRIAMNTQDWSSGGGEADAWISMQPDPNWCDDECKPFLDAGVTLGFITSDGGNTYAPITGDLICASYIDSVQNFDLGGGWNWRNFTAPFDNDSTMGLYVNTRTVGALDVPELANVTVEVMEFTERNGGTVEDWYFGAMIDYDVGGDTAIWNGDYSVAYSPSATLAGDVAWGLVKIPFGCGYEPMINAYALDAGQAQFSTDANGNPYWDSVYTYMSLAPGSYGHSSVSTGPDQEFHATIAGHDFGPNETIEFAVANFGLFGIADMNNPVEIFDLATLVNQWAGFGRGDVNNDGGINLADIIYLAGTVNGGPGAVPFEHLSDVNADSGIDVADVDYLIDYYFNCGPCPMGDFIF